MPILETFGALLSAISLQLQFTEFTKSGKERKVQALSSLQLAVIKTDEYLKKSGYEPNTELSQLWLDAFNQIQSANLVNDYYQIENIYHKARFWSDPKKWLKEKASMELVPKLVELQKHCDSFIGQITNA
jgi:hypothetical protein